MEPHSKKDYSASSEAEDPGPTTLNPSTARPLSSQSGSVFRQPAEDASRKADAPGFFQLISGLFRGNGHNGNGKHETTLREAVEALIEEHAPEGEGPVIPPEEQAMLRNILRFGEMTVSDIMCPRTDIIAVEHDVPLEELKEIIVSEQHSRIPVYADNLDQIRGFLHVKDLAVSLFSGKAFHMDSLMREILFVPPSMRVLDLLVKMRQSGVHIAIVVDEYGGTDGLVSMEDIVEEIVGDIQDEHDEEEEADSFIWVGESTIEADARMEIEKLDHCFGEQIVLDEDEKECDTVGGLVFAHLGHIPEAGEQFDYPTGLRITILEAEPRAVKRVRIERLARQPESAMVTEK